MSKIKQILSKISDFLKISGIALLVGILGAWGGQNNKWIRRFIIPVIFTICAYIELKSLYVLFILMQIGFLSIGYGIMDENDKGSALARFWYNILKRKELLNYFVRGTVGLGISLSFLVISILKWNWFVYFLNSLGIILVWSFISWQGFGEISIKIKDKIYTLLKVDLVTYGVVGLCGLLIIYKG